jgi:hypothetical protein
MCPEWKWEWSVLISGTHRETVKVMPQGLSRGHSNLAHRSRFTYYENCTLNILKNAKKFEKITCVHQDIICSHTQFDREISHFCGMCKRDKKKSMLKIYFGAYKIFFSAHAIQNEFLSQTFVCEHLDIFFEIFRHFEIYFMRGRFWGEVDFCWAWT